MMNNEKVCPLEKAGSLDSWWRKLLQNPNRLLKPHIKSGMTVLDFGCGPGYFTFKAAELAGENGKIIAVDLQQGMLDILKSKIADSELKNRIKLHKCEADKIGITEEVDFIIAIYVIHETPDPNKTLKEMYDMLKPGSRLLSIDPKRHFSKEGFEEMIEIAKSIGFKIIESRTGFIDYIALLEK